MSSTKDHETARMRKSHLKKSNAASEYEALTIGRGVGTCLRVEGKTKIGGGKTKNFMGKFLFCSNFGEFSAKVGGGGPAFLFSIPLRCDWYC